MTLTFCIYKPSFIPDSEIFNPRLSQNTSLFPSNFRKYQRLLPKYPAYIFSLKPGSVTSLEQYLESHPTPPKEIRLSLIRQIFKNLYYLHSAQIIHTHLNLRTLAVWDRHILLTFPNEPQSLSYRSLEVLIGNSTVPTMAGDIWAAGVIAFEILFQRPFATVRLPDNPSPAFQEQAIQSVKQQISVSLLMDGFTPPQDFTEKEQENLTRFLRRIFTPFPETRPSALDLLLDPFLWDSEPIIHNWITEYPRGNRNPFIKGKGTFSTVYAYKSHAIKEFQDFIDSTERNAEFEILSYLKDTSSPYYNNICHMTVCYPLEKSISHIVFPLQTCDLDRYRRHNPYFDLKALTAEILKGLIHLHSTGIIHTDLKPGNILITPPLGIKLADFGSALLTTDLPDFPISTPYFRAPESSLQIDALFGKTVDIWSLAPTVYYLQYEEYLFKCEDTLFSNTPQEKSLSVDFSLMQDIHIQLQDIHIQLQDIQCQHSFQSFARLIPRNTHNNHYSYQVLRTLERFHHVYPGCLRKKTSPDAPAIERLINRCLQLHPQNRPDAQELLAELIQ